MLDSEALNEIATGISLYSYFDGEDMVINVEELISVLSPVFKEDNPRFSPKMFRDGCKRRK